jgi:hypothetical protein
MKTFTVTPTYDLLLRGNERVPYGLYQLQLLTAEQLTRLHYQPGTLKTVKARLKALADHGYVQADAMPIRHETARGLLYGSPYYYTLGPAGVRYLKEAGYATAASWRPSREVEKSLLFLQHTLEINDILISAAKLTGAYRLERMTHERVLKRKPFTFKYEGTTYGLVPDGFLRFETPTRPRRFLLEHDRAREPNADIRRKIRAYRALLRSEPFPILFTTFAGDAHRDRLRSWVRAELVRAKEPPEIGRYFYFAAFARPPGPEVWTSPVWYTSYGDPPRALL